MEVCGSGGEGDAEVVKRVMKELLQILTKVMKGIVCTER